MYFLSLFWFLFCSYGIGAGLLSIVREPDDFIERNLMRFGIGLASLLTIGFILNILRIPLDYRVFIGLAVLLLAIKIWLKTKSKQLWNFEGFKLNFYTIGMLLIFSITLFMYMKGSFAYPYLEDDDPWSHAIGVKYVSIDKTVLAGKGNVFHYIDPYPPAYDMLFGIIHQTNDSVNWTLKFFNALIISITMVFFFYFVKLFTESSKKAFVATFILAAVPAFMSHFIWALALTVPLMFVCFYCLEKIKDDSKYAAILAIVLVPTITSSPTHSAYFAVLLSLYFIGKILVEKKIFTAHLFGTIVGFVLSAILWWIPMLYIYGYRGMLEGLGLKAQSALNVAGTADRAYVFKDFISANSQNMINNPVGYGPIVFILFIISFFVILIRYRKEIVHHKVLIGIIFAVIFIGSLIFLQQTYTKFVEKRGVVPLPPGSVPFFQFFSDQIFLIMMLAMILFSFTLLVVLNWKLTEKKESHMVTLLLWSAMSFYAVHAAPFFVKLSPFRAWGILAIPLAIMVSYAIVNITTLIAAFFGRSKAIVSAILITIIILGIYFTSFVPKFSLNTSQWPPGGAWTSQDELVGYIWMMDSIPKNSRVFTFSNGGAVIGFDQFNCRWCANDVDYLVKGFNETPEQNYNYFKKNSYKYFLIDGQAARRFGLNETQNKLEKVAGFNKFRPVYTKGFFLFEVV